MDKATAQIPTDQSKTVGLILAGGRSSRMLIANQQTDKAWVDLNGQALIHHVEQRLRAQVGLIWVSANESIERYVEAGLIPLADALNERPGPLAGVLVGLAKLNEQPHQEWLQLAPCDGPLLPRELVTILLSARDQAALSSAQQIDLVIPIDQTGQAQPMFALLHKTLLTPLTDFFNRGERSLLYFAKQNPASLQVTFNELPRDSFVSVNTNEQLQTLQRLFAII